MLICGVCLVVWPCAGIQRELRNAAEKRQKQESDSGEHLSGGSGGKAA